MLLDKYLDGTSSLEEENVLKEFFSKENVPEEFRSEAQWFNHTRKQAIKEEDIRLLETGLSNWVDEQSRNERTVRMRSWLIGIAAGLAILIGATFFLKHKTTDKTLDTYEDPQIAYLEAKKVLLYVSQTLNKGTEKLETVSRIQEGTNEMSIFSTFGSGLKNLDLISKYQDDHIEKQ